MTPSLRLLLAVCATMAALPCRAVEPDPLAASTPARLSFADGWTLRSSEPSDGRQAETDAAGSSTAPRTATPADR